MGNRKNFTMMDLIAIVATVAAVLITLGPAWGIGGGARNAKRIKNENQMRGVITALTVYGSTHNDSFPEGKTLARFDVLCNAGADGISPVSLVNPAGTDKEYAAEEKKPVKLAAGNVSYALLSASSKGWTNDTNASCPLICDKQVGKGSFWNNQAWEGNIGWGDNHVDYNNSAQVSTVIDGETMENDDIWKKGGAVMENP